MVEPGCVEDPERAGGSGCELDEQRECELRGAGRRKLSELLARECAPEDRERRSRGRQPELVGRGRDGGPCLSRLEPVLDGDRDDRVAEEVERSSLTPAVGQPPRPHLAGTKRRTQVGRKKRRGAAAWLSGADRRRTGDQLRGQRGTDRRDDLPVRRSFHSFHSPILRSMNVLNNGPSGPTARSCFLNATGTVDPRVVTEVSCRKRCPFPALNKAVCAVSERLRARCAARHVERVRSGPEAVIHSFRTPEPFRN